MRKTSYILRVKLHIDCSKLFALSREHYVKKIVEWFIMQDCNSIDTPFVRGENLGKEISLKNP